MDIDKMNHITIVEFVKIAVAAVRNDDRERTLREIFRVFDRNCDGNINSSELAYVI